MRQGLAGKLPIEVIWRGKSKFCEGSGSGLLLTEYANQQVSDQEFAANRDLNGGETQLQSTEEYLYYQIFNEIFGDSIPWKRSEGLNTANELWFVNIQKKNGLSKPKYLTSG